MGKLLRTNREGTQAGNPLRHSPLQQHLCLSPATRVRLGKCPGLQAGRRLFQIHPGNEVGRVDKHPEEDRSALQPAEEPSQV